MTVQRAYLTPPATHLVTNNQDPSLPPMGARLRMKGSYNCTARNAFVQVLCGAFKKYGLILADIGGNWYVSGAPHPLWDDNVVSDLKNIPASAFEVVDTGAKLCLNPECTITG
eukprot:TRINITY_DN3060_c0_g1_i4.p1 TRINITY_DN3060_c0_g1~~TRINITY_DN3060_c0_g1_i4.p1  ORF type:complete len:113 (+),score=18.56 TRINITY_DN3060_c0_g1_i4:48-386(+)